MNPYLRKVSFSNGTELICSPTHMVYTEEGWASILNLQNTLNKNSRNKVKALSEDETFIEILDIVSVTYPSDTFVYLMEIENNHDLFAHGILCHNYQLKMY